MKTMIELTKYHGHSYLKSNKYVMPLAVFFVLLYVNYSIIPLRVIDSFCISCVYAFMIMVWAGIGYNESEPLISRQILVLRVQSASRYYISDSAFLLLLGFGVSLLGIGFPIVQNLANNGNVFLRPLTAADLIGSFFLLWASTFAGGAVGTLFHPEVLTDRRIAVVLTVLFALLAVVKTGIAKEVPTLEAVLWIFPPVAELSSDFALQETYRFGEVAVAVGHLCVYCIFVTGVKIWILNRKKFT